MHDDGPWFAPDLHLLLGAADAQLDVAWNRPWYERHGFEVVAPVAWTPAMHAITTAQIAAGLDPRTRCHMRARLT